MKRFLLVSLAIAACMFSATSCGMKEENEKLVRQVDSLKTVVRSKQQMIDNQSIEIEKSINSINEIQNAIDAISQKQKELTAQSSEQTVVTDDQKRAKLKADLDKLCEEITANRKKIDQLTYQLSQSKKEVKGLNEMVANLQAQIEQKDKDIAELRAVIEKQTAQIVELQEDVTTKTQQIKDLENTIAEQIADMNEAWYCVAKKADLRENLIIDKKGKIITKSDKHFTKIDVTKVTSIPVNTKKLIVLSAHPLNSYEFVYEGKYIKSVKIKDAEAFWRLGNRFVAISK